MELNTLEQYLLGVVVATCLGFALIYFLGVRKSEPDDSLDFHKPTNDFTQTRQQDDGAIDVIIVGAGVAGAALAYSLGKVPFFPSKFRFYGCIFKIELQQWKVGHKGNHD